MKNAVLDELGREVHDPTPIAIPAQSYHAQEIDRIRSIIRRELSRAAEDNAFETFEEADDFDCEEDGELMASPYEEFFDPETGESSFARPVPEAAPEAAAAAQTDTLSTGSKVVPPDGSQAQTEGTPDTVAT